MGPSGRLKWRNDAILSVNPCGPFDVECCRVCYVRDDFVWVFAGRPERRVHRSVPRYAIFTGMMTGPSLDRKCPSRDHARMYWASLSWWLCSPRNDGQHGVWASNHDITVSAMSLTAEYCWTQNKPKLHGMLLSVPALFNPIFSSEHGQNLLRLEWTATCPRETILSTIPSHTSPSARGKQRTVPRLRWSTQPRRVVNEIIQQAGPLATPSRATG